jgi:transketolase
MIGAATGLALRGRIPVTHALASFLTMRAFEFIRTDVGISGLPVKLVGSFAGFLSEANGPTHQAIEDVALMRSVPHVNVWCPADRQELVLGLERVLMAPQPYYIRYNSADPVVEHDRNFEPGVAEVLAQGQDVTILTYGYLFRECYRAAKLLRLEGYSVGLVNMRTLKPVDRKTILGVADNSQCLAVVEDHLRSGGLYSIVAETLLAARVTARVLGINLEERWFKPAMLPAVLAHEGFDATGLAQRICLALAV